MAVKHSLENDRAVMNMWGYVFMNVQMLRTALDTWRPDFPDGNKRLALVGDKVLALIFDLDGYSRNDTRVLNPSQSSVSNDIMATTVEALVGAIYLDSGNLEVVKAAMIEFGIMQAETEV
ncbi:uncharacterized protein N7511_006713 [Penicillium nucicola]|uniref:uncharacterized protein n=1 Tax=Penicillium nucicola TaxID=1850975 RepID=UPI00254503B8|nr:uncharacterized protein N7511_006713 [Penicillium nucicola]KAJ5758019.1 hypothetical protein N7511_006713 [Penicillium nucicola]